MTERPLFLRVAAFALAAFLIWDAGPVTAQPFMANAVKIGEVTSTSAMVWSRLTAAPNRNLSGPPFLPGEVRVWSRRPNESSDDPYWGQIPPGKSLPQMLNAVPGSSGFVRLTYWKQGKEERTTTDWIAVDAGDDFTHQFELTTLQPGSIYEFKVEGSEITKEQLDSLRRLDSLLRGAMRRW